MDQTNKNKPVPSLMGYSAEIVNAETVKSGMLARLENPTQQKKSTYHKSSGSVAPTNSLRYKVMVFGTFLTAITLLYFVWQKNAVLQESESDAGDSNKITSVIDANESVIKLSQTALAVTAEVPVELSTTATIVSAPEASQSTNTSAPVIEGEHEELSNLLMAENDSGIHDKLTETVKKSAEEADASRHLASTLATIQAEPVDKKPAVAKPQSKAPKHKTEAKPLHKSKLDSDIRIIDALVADTPTNPKDRDIKVLTALVSANSVSTGKAQLNTQSTLVTEKTRNNTLVSPVSRHMQPKLKPELNTQPMTLGNAGETTADQLAKCSALNFIQAPICRVKTCFGHVGSIPECTPEFKKQEANSDAISVIGGH